MQLIPLLLITSFVHLRNLVLHVCLPLYDVVSDVVAGYYYYDEEVYLITALILLFILLPHILLSLTLILEMIVDVGEFDEYPKALVRFYKSKPTPFNLLNNTIKFITLPLFTLLNFFWFFTSLITRAIVLLGRLFCLLGTAVAQRVGQRHPETLRVDNVKDDAWSKTILMELFFETIPQLVTQVSALAALYGSDDFVRGFPIVSSVVVSVINLMHQTFILRGFMYTTDLTLLNTIRYMLNGALDFFPLLNLYRNSTEHVLIEYCDNPVLLELWGPLQSILGRNTSLKALTLYLEDTRDWMDMSMDLLDSVAANEKMHLDVLDVCVEAENAEQARKVAVRMEDLKARFYELLRKNRTKRIFFLIDSTVDIGIVEAPIDQMTVVSKEVDGFKWSWEWPGGKTARLEYKIEQAQ